MGQIIRTLRSLRLLIFVIPRERPARLRVSVLLAFDPFAFRSGQTHFFLGFLGCAPQFLDAASSATASRAGSLVSAITRPIPSHWSQVTAPSPWQDGQFRNLGSGGLIPRYRCRWSCPCPNEPLQVGQVTTVT